MVRQWQGHDGRAQVPSTSGSVPKRTATRKKKHLAALAGIKQQARGKNDEKKRAPQWPVRRLMARGPITVQAPKASHRRGPTLGLNQPVTSVKRLPGPPPLKSYLRIFPRPLSRALPSSLNQSIRLRAPCRPALSNERAAQKQARPKGKKRALPALTRAIRFVRKGTNETLASASLAIHSDSTIVPIRLSKPRASERKP